MQKETLEQKVSETQLSRIQKGIFNKIMSCEESSKQDWMCYFAEKAKSTVFLLEKIYSPGAIKKRNKNTKTKCVSDLMCYDIQQLLPELKLYFRLIELVQNNSKKPGIYNEKTWKKIKKESIASSKISKEKIDAIYNNLINWKKKNPKYKREDLTDYFIQDTIPVSMLKVATYIQDRKPRINKNSKTKTYTKNKIEQELMTEIKLYHTILSKLNNDLTRAVYEEEFGQERNQAAYLFGFIEASLKK